MEAVNTRNYQFKIVVNVFLHDIEYKLGRSFSCYGYVLVVVVVVGGGGATQKTLTQE